MRSRAQPGRVRLPSGAPQRRPGSRAGEPGQVNSINFPNGALPYYQVRPTYTVKIRNVPSRFGFQ